MKFPLGSVIRFAVELAVDLVTGKLERPYREVKAPTRPAELALSVLRTEAAADSIRCTLPPDGWRCARRRGHLGPCAAAPIARVPGDRSN